MEGLLFNPIMEKRIRASSILSTEPNTLGSSSSVLSLEAWAVDFEGYGLDLYLIIYLFFKIFCFS